MPNTTDVEIVDFADVPRKPADTPLTSEWLLIAATPDGAHAYLCTLKEVREALVGLEGLPIPAAPTFADFSDTPEGGSVRLVAATGLQLTDYKIKIGASGPYTAAPVDGVINVGNVTGPVYAYSVPTATRAQSQAGVSPLFTVVNPEDPFPVPETPPTLPTYHGPVASVTPTSSQLQALATDTWAKDARVLSYSCNGTYPAFAEPASYGVRNIIQDKNGYNITGDVERATVFLTVGDAEVAYNRYVHTNPQYDPDFKFVI